MAFDKYVLGILSILHKHCGDCGCASFVPKYLLFQCFRTILVPFVCPVRVLKSIMVSSGTEQQAGGCDQEKGSAEHWISWISAWRLPPCDSWAHPALFCASFSWWGWDQSSGQAQMMSFCKGALYQWDFEIGKGNILSAGAKQSVIQCISDLTGQSPLP